MVVISMIRQVEIGDEKEIAKIVIDSWKTSYQGIIEDDYLTDLNYRKKEEELNKDIIKQEQNGYYLYVYEDDAINKILGFIILGPPREKETINFDMEIYELYIESNNKYKGIGTKLINFAKNKMISLGVRNIYLWCLSDNLSGIRFYKKMGGVILKEENLLVGNKSIKNTEIGFNLCSLPTIETDRLIIRKFVETDIDDFYEYASDNEVTRYLSWDTYKNKDIAKEYITSIIEKYNRYELAPWGIELKENSKLIGSIDFVQYDYKNFSAEIGYVLNKNYWNKGIMTEALRAIIKFGFEKMDLVRIEMKHNVKNIGSERVIQKNALKYEGTLRKKEFLKKEFVDVKYYSILKEEYYNNTNNETKRKKYWFKLIVIIVTDLG